MQEAMILFSSKTGHTERYAHWLGEALGAEVLPLGDCRPERLADHALILCGGGVYAGELDGIKGYRKLRKRWPDKSFVYFAVGLSPPEEELVRKLLDYNFPKEAAPPLFYLRGGLKRDKLPSAQRAMLAAFRAMLSRKRNLPEKDRAMLALLEADGSDYSSREEMEALVAYAKMLLSGKGTGGGEGG